MEYLAGRFNGLDWGANGPKAITNVMYDLCNVKHSDNMTPEKCLGTKIFPPSAFYKIPWRKWRDIFDPVQSEEILFSLKITYFCRRFDTVMPFTKTVVNM